jgi:hypothetical protein
MVSFVWSEKGGANVAHGWAFFPAFRLFFYSVLSLLDLQKLIIFIFTGNGYSCCAFFVE